MNPIEEKESFGISLGSTNSILSKGTKARIICIQNDLSNITTPSIMGFTEFERIHGQTAQIQFITNYKNSIPFIPRLLNIYPEELEEEMKYLGVNILQIKERQNEFYFQVNRNRKEELFRPEQILAMFIIKILHKEIQNVKKSKAVVISVPHYFTVNERIALLNSCSIAGISISKVLNENSACGLEYAMNNLSELNYQNRNVLFIDIGHCKTTMFIIKFNGLGMEIISQVFDKNLGGRNFDWKILERITEIFQHKYKINLYDNKKCLIKILDVASKAKKILSANKETMISIESLYENRDLDYNLTREEFEKLNMFFANKISQMISEVLERSKLNPYQIYSVELLGEATRIQFVQQAIINVIPQSEIKRTFNSTERIAKGCAIMAMMLNQEIKTIKYEIKEICPFSVDLEKFSNENPENIETIHAYDSNTIFPISKQVLIKDSDKIIELNLKCTNMDTFKNTSPKIMKRYKIYNLLQKPFNLNVEIDRNMIPNIFIPSKENQSSDSQKDINIFYVNHGLNRKEITDFYNLENQMQNEDFKIIKSNEIRVEFESFIYDIKAKINDEYGTFADEATKKSLFEQLESNQKWLAEDGKNANLEEFQARIKSLRDISDPIVRRKSAFDDISSSLNKLDNAINSSYNNLHKLNEIKKKLLENKIKEGQQMRNDILNMLSSCDFSKDPNISHAIIEKMIKEILDVY